MIVQQPLVPEAYQKLGDEWVESLRYTKTRVEDALDVVDQTKTLDNKIASILKRKLTQGFISSKDLKSTLANAFKVVARSETATASDITRWYDAEQMVKSIEGKIVRGYNIFKPKYLFDTADKN